MIHGVYCSNVIVDFTFRVVNAYCSNVSVVKAETLGVLQTSLNDVQHSPVGGDLCLLSLTSLEIYLGEI